MLKFKNKKASINFLSDYLSKQIQINQLPKRTLGKTGLNVSIFSLGGQGSLESQGTTQNNINIIRRAYDLGVNYFDTSPEYDDSELSYGLALEDIRDNVYLATKSKERDYDGVMRDFENSLKKLKTDYIDIYQIHNLTSKDDINYICNNALKAFINLKEQGVVKNIGITGHENPEILLDIMKRYQFDTVLCPVNICDKAMNISFLNTVVEEANNQNMGIIGMKVLSQGHFFENYMNLETLLKYPLSYNIDNIIVGCDDLYQLEKNIDIVSNFINYNQEDLEKIEKKYFGFKRFICFFREEFGGYRSKDSLVQTKKILDLDEARKRFDISKHRFCCVCGNEETVRSSEPKKTVMVKNCYSCQNKKVGSEETTLNEI